MRQDEARLLHEGETGERDIARGGAVFKEEVRDLGRAIVGVDDVRPDLHSHTGAPADRNAFKRMLAGDFQIDRQRFSELDGVVHG